MIIKKLPTYNIFECLDIETIEKNNILYPYCVAITDNNKTKYKKININEIETTIICEFILKECKSTYIYYVHNLTFETFVLLEGFTKLNCKIKWLCIKKNIYYLKITHNNKTLKFRCSYKLTMLSLKQGCKELLNVEKLNFPYKILNTNIKKIIKLKIEDFNNYEEYIEFKKKNNLIINTDKILKEYCINDVIITKKLINEYWKQLKNIGLEDNGKMLTASSIALYNMYKTVKNVKKNIKKDVDELIRKNYHGGRTEVFGNSFNKDEIILHYDWAGMYGQCMEEKLPCGEYYTTEYVDKTFKTPGFYSIHFEQCMEIPVLPIKEDKLYFKNGIYKGIYWNEEILLFIKKGGKILNTKFMIKPQFYTKCLQNYVKSNNKLRKKGGILKQIGKNNINTLYGRLGIKKIINIQEIGYEKNKEFIHKINNTYINEIQKNNKSPSNIIIASAITSKARIKLYKGFEEIIKNKGRLLYCDTDSIIAAFNKKDYKKVINKPLGEVYFDSKKKDTIIKKAVFCLPKTYGLILNNNESIVKIKGFKSKISFNKLKYYFIKDKEILIENEEFIKNNWNITIKNNEKTLKLDSYNKRIWTNSEKTHTKPLNQNTHI